MKKLIIGVAILTTAILGGCNKQNIDYFFRTAYVKMPDGRTKTLRLKSWKNYEGKQLLLESKSGYVYLVSSINVVLTDK